LELPLLQLTPLLLLSHFISLTLFFLPYPLLFPLLFKLLRSKSLRRLALSPLSWLLLFRSLRSFGCHYDFPHLTFLEFLVHIRSDVGLIDKNPTSTVDVEKVKPCFQNLDLFASKPLLWLDRGYAPAKDGTKAIE
jgi:hypothetical protein